MDKKRIFVIWEKGIVNEKISLVEKKGYIVCFTMFNEKVE